jgi:hypothetical protein
VYRLSANPILTGSIPVLTTMGWFTLYNE